LSGKALRLRRIFKEDGKTVIVALDHGQFQGPLKGIYNMRETLQNIVSTSPDGLILNPGIVTKHYDIIAGKTSIIVRISGASTILNPIFDYHRLTTSVEHALYIGGDAVIVMGFIGGEGERFSYELVGKIAEKCDKYGVPLFVEVIPQDTKHFMNPDYILTGARAAYELGADVLKVYYTDRESFRKIVDTVSIPVVIAGGPKNKDALTTVKEALEMGAKGVAFGRNVFQAYDPAEYVKELMNIVHLKGG